MKKSLSVSTLCAMAALLVGCGGSSGGAGGTVGAVAGNYTGTYANTGSSPFNGTFTLTIDSDGLVLGRTSDSRFGAGTISTGRLTPSGRLSVSVNYEALSPVVSTVTVGQLSRDTLGVLTGNARETRVTESNPVTITLTPASG